MQRIPDILNSCNKIYFNREFVNASFLSYIYFARIWSTSIKKACPFKQAFTVFSNKIELS